MAYPKGQKRPQTAGRKKGTPNAVTLENRVWLTLVLENNREKLERELSQLSGFQFVSVYEKLMAYVMPKYQSIELQQPQKQIMLTEVIRKLELLNVDI